MQWTAWAGHVRSTRAHPASSRRMLVWNCPSSPCPLERSVARPSGERAWSSNAISAIVSSAAMYSASLSAPTISLMVGCAGRGRGWGGTSSGLRIT